MNSKPDHSFIHSFIRSFCKKQLTERNCTVKLENWLKYYNSSNKFEFDFTLYVRTCPLVVRGGFQLNQRHDWFLAVRVRDVGAVGSPSRVTNTAVIDLFPQPSLIVVCVRAWT